MNKLFRNDDKTIKTLWIFIGLGLFLAFFGIYNSYSYWWDELYSVVASSSDLKFMFSDFIMPDVHPPLYQLILKCWIELFSNSEVATRVLSLIFSISGFYVIWMWGKKNLSKIAMLSTLVFYSTNNLFIYYSQEVRSYSMMLCLSTIVSVLFASYIKEKGKNNKTLSLLLFSGLVLSLTHYFGLIYFLVILIVLFIYNIVAKKLLKNISVMLTAILCMAWPVFHFSYGEVGDKSGGNFWIKSEGIQTTFSIASKSVFPQIAKGFSTLFSISNEYIISISFGFLLIIIFVLAARSSSSKNVYTKSTWVDHPYVNWFAGVVVTFLILIAWTDLSSPISTVRNFIVIVPIVSIVFGVATERLFIINRPLAYILIGILAISNIFGFIYTSSSLKGRPAHQNHKEASEFIVENLSGNNYNIYYTDKGIFLDSMHYYMARFYIDKLSVDNSIEIDKISVDCLADLEKPYMIFIQHDEGFFIEAKEILDKIEIQFEDFIPDQRTNGAMVIKVE